MIAEHHYRPLALVFQGSADERERDCRLLSEKGYKAIEFADNVNTEAWLEEETPEVAVLGRTDYLRQGRVIETLKGRGVMLIPRGCELEMI
jgi:hypothetical protein